MTTNTAALVRQMRELMREFLDDYDNGGMRSLKHYARPMNEAVASADQWLAQQRGPLTDEEIDKVLSTRVPGGSSARDWFLPHTSEKANANIRTVVRLMIERAVETACATAWGVKREGEE